MKTLPPTPARRRTSGSVLLVSVLTLAIIAMGLGGYLVIVGNQNRSVMRSMQWNAAIPLSEAGIEEALAQLNNRDVTNFSGWTATNTQWKMQRTVGNAFYIVTLNTSVYSSPIILSTGYAPEPANAGQAGASNQAYLQRTVRVTTTRDNLFARGMVAKAGISWSGNIFTDSFDSLDPNYSTAGRYDSAKAKDNGSIGANSGNLNLGGGKVYGSASTGPTGSLNNGTVGDVAWVGDGSNSGKVQPGRYNNDMNLSFPDVNEPFVGGYFTPIPGVVTTTNIITSTNNVSSWSVPTSTNTITGVWTTNLISYPTGAPYVLSNSVVTVKGNKKTTNILYSATNWIYASYSSTTNLGLQTYDYVLDTGNYQLSSLSLSGQARVLVRGDAVLYVKGSFAMTGQAQIEIAAGASLKVYVAGDVDLKGNGIMNANVDALKFGLYGLPTCTSIAMGGNASFTGTIYAPQATFSAGGGGNNQYDCVGAVIANSISMNGHFSFHYDEALGRSGPGRGFVITSWNEQ